MLSQKPDLEGFWTFLLSEAPMYWNAHGPEKLLDSEWLNSTRTIDFNHLRIQPR
jgi:hypothetical protein